MPMGRLHYGWLAARSALEISTPTLRLQSRVSPRLPHPPAVRELDQSSADTMDRNSTPPKYLAPGYDHSDLEAVPIPQLEATGWHQQQQQQQEMVQSPPGAWVEPPQAINLPVEPPQRILGLSVKAFWILVVLLVVIVAGGIGGGVGGGLAARSRADSST